MMATINGVDERDIPTQRPEKNDDPLNPANLLPFSKEIGAGTALPEEPRERKGLNYAFPLKKAPQVEIPAEPEV